MSIAELTHRFTYHAPTPEQQVVYAEIRERALIFALRLSELVPNSRELSTALTKLDEVVMFANAGIARNVVADPAADTVVDGERLTP